MKQSAAAAAAAMVQTLMFVSAGILIIVSSIVTRAIGYGAWFSILGGLQLAVSAGAYVQILRRLSAHRGAGATSSSSSGSSSGPLSDSAGRVNIDAESPPSPRVHASVA
jgi:hypothetical protein